MPPLQNRLPDCRGCKKSLPPENEWSHSYCSACLDKEKARSKTRRAKDREGIFDPEVQSRGQPSKFPKPPLYHFGGHVCTDRNWEHLRKSLFAHIPSLQSPSSLHLPLSLNDHPIIELVQISFCKHASCHQPLPFATNPTFCIHCETRRYKRRRADNDGDDPSIPSLSSKRPRRAVPTIYPQVDSGKDDNSIPPPPAMRPLRVVGPIITPRFRLLESFGEANARPTGVSSQSGVNATSASDPVEDELRIPHFSLPLAEPGTDPQAERALVEASRDGNFKAVEALLEKGINVDSLSNIAIKLYGYLDSTALRAASYEGHTDIVILLLEKGANVDLVDGDDWTALHWASRQGHIEVVKVILREGAHIDLVGHGGQTALHLACSEGHSEVVKILLETGASVDLAAHHSQTALYRACSEGHSEVVKILLEMGASADLAGHHGRAALHLALWKGYSEVAKILLEKGSKVDLADHDGQTTLRLACKKGHSEVVKLLLDEGASIDVADSDGQTALHVACEEGHSEVVKSLLEMGASVNLIDKEERSSLHLACKEGHIEVVEILLDWGASVDLADDSELTALHLACEDGDTEIAKILLEKGAGVDLTDSDGQTALHLACKKGHAGVARALLERRASVNQISQLSSWADGGTELQIACSSTVPKTSVVQMLLDAGADPNLVDTDHKTPLHSACKRHNIKIIELLLEKGADPYLESGENGSAISYVREDGDTELLRLLETHSRRPSPSPRFPPPVSFERVQFSPLLHPFYTPTSYQMYH